MSFQESFEKAHDAAGAPKTLHGLPADGRYQGTCQACFGAYVTKAGKLRQGTRSGRADLIVVLHGYERPGHGYIQGECPGRAELPFELDKTVTERFRSKLMSMLASYKSYLARLQADEVDKLTIEIRDESIRYDYGTPRSKLYKRIEIERGWKNPKTYGDDFRTRLESEIAHTKMNVSQISDDLKTVNSRLAGWKYDPKALVEAEEREKTVKAQKTAARKATFDEKEGREEAVLAAFIENPTLVEYLKNKPHMEFDRAVFKDKPTGRSKYDEVMRYIDSARRRDIFGDRSYGRRRAISDLRNLARDAGVKIKAPKW